ncbi:MAG: peptidoglycan DD-metalloendopeptidase family protein [Thermotogota bacterium]
MHYFKSKKVFIILTMILFSLYSFGIEYTVKPGDNLTKISKKTGVSVQLIIEANQFLTEQKYLKLNQKIKIPDENVFIYEIKSGDNIYDISKIFFIRPENIIKENNIKNANNIYIGQKLKIPFDKMGSCFNKDTSISWPITGYVTSEYGYRIHPIYNVRKFHHGIDIAAPTGTPIFSASDGIVVEVEEDSGYGKHIVVKGTNEEYIYAHLSEFNVVPGVLVKKGHLIGKVGNTGLSTGPHLHFQINDNLKSSLNPRYYLGDMRYAYIYPNDFSAMGGE